MGVRGHGAGAEVKEELISRRGWGWQKERHTRQREQPVQRPEDRENMVSARVTLRQCGWTPEGQARVLGSKERELWEPD